jgi:hypothetical protein
MAKRLLELTKKRDSLQEEILQLNKQIDHEFPGYASWRNEHEHDAEIIVEAYESALKDAGPTSSGGAE